VLGGIQQLEILLDRRSFRRAGQQLIIGHAEPRGGVHVVHVFVIDERTGLADQGVDHVTKVDGFLAVAEQSWHPLEAVVLVPQLKMILVNADLHFQADVLAADRIRVPLHANHTIGLHRYRSRSARGTTLRWHGGEDGELLTKPFFSRSVEAADELTHEGHVVLRAGEVAASPQSQGLVECILDVTMQRLDITILMRLADVDAMAAETVMCEQVAVLCGELLIVREVVHRC